MGNSTRNDDVLIGLETICSERVRQIGGYDRYEWDVKIEDDTVRIHVQNMYSLGEFISFDFLAQIADFLGTKNINLEDKNYEPGCESCDWGSVDEVTIVARGCVL